MRSLLRPVDDSAELEETMSQTVANELQSRRSGGANAIAGTAAWIRLILTAAMKLWITRRDERILMQAPAHRLRDIGIERADIRYAVRSGRVGRR